MRVDGCVCVCVCGGGGGVVLTITMVMCQRTVCMGVGDVCVGGRGRYDDNDVSQDQCM